MSEHPPASLPTASRWRLLAEYAAGLWIAFLLLAYLQVERRHLEVAGRLARAVAHRLP